MVLPTSPRRKSEAGGDALEKINSTVKPNKHSVGIWRFSINRRESPKRTERPWRRKRVITCERETVSISQYLSKKTKGMVWWSFSPSPRLKLNSFIIIYYILYIYYIIYIIYINKKEKKKTRKPELLRVAYPPEKNTEILRYWNTPDNFIFLSKAKWL